MAAVRGVGKEAGVLESWVETGLSSFPAILQERAGVSALDVPPGRALPDQQSAQQRDQHEERESEHTRHLESAAEAG